MMIRHRSTKSGTIWPEILPSDRGIKRLIKCLPRLLCKFVLPILLGVALLLYIFEIGA